MRKEKMRFGILKNESGMSLIELMIATAVLVVLAFGLSEILVTSTKQDREIKFRQSIFTSRERMRYEEKITPMPSPEP